MQKAILFLFDQQSLSIHNMHALLDYERSLWNGHQTIYDINQTKRL